MMGDVLGFKPTVVAYRGSAPAITDLLGGQIDLLWDQVTNAITQVQAGALHGIAITSPERLEQLKDVPTTAELGMPEVSYTMWHGLYVTKGTPKAVAALNAALRKALSDPGVVAKLKQLGTLPFPDAEMSPEAHASLFAWICRGWQSWWKVRGSRRARRSRRVAQAFSVHLRLREPRRAGVAAHDRHALLVAQHVVDIASCRPSLSRRLAP